MAILYRGAVFQREKWKFRNLLLDFMRSWLIFLVCILVCFLEILKCSFMRRCLSREFSPCSQNSLVWVALDVLGFWSLISIGLKDHACYVCYGRLSYAKPYHLYAGYPSMVFVPLPYDSIKQRNMVRAVDIGNIAQQHKPLCHAFLVWLVSNLCSIVCAFGF